MFVYRLGESLFRQSGGGLDIETSEVDGGIRYVAVDRERGRIPLPSQPLYKTQCVRLAGTQVCPHQVKAGSGIGRPRGDQPFEPRPELATIGPHIRRLGWRNNRKWVCP